MKVWHIVSRNGFERMQRNGLKRGHSDFICDEFFRDAYGWMIEQMEQRLSSIRPESAYPVWVWYRYNGTAESKPDVNDPYGEPNQPLVLLELEVPENEVLLSDFELWHAVLNDFAIDLDDKNCRAVFGCSWESLAGTDLERKRKSWEVIFDLNFNDEEWTSPPETRAIQGCIWELKWEYVKSYHHFLSAEENWDDD